MPKRNDKQCRPWSAFSFRRSVWSGSTLLAKASLSQNLGLLRYTEYLLQNNWKQNIVLIMNAAIQGQKPYQPYFLGAYPKCFWDIRDFFFYF